jgi:hypothetical protein
MYKTAELEFCLRSYTGNLSTGIHLLSHIDVG